MFNTAKSLLKWERPKGILHFFPTKEIVGKKSNYKNTRSAVKNIFFWICFKVLSVSLLASWVSFEARRTNATLPRPTTCFIASTKAETHPNAKPRRNRSPHEVGQVGISHLKSTGCSCCFFNRKLLWLAGWPAGSRLGWWTLCRQRKLRCCLLLLRVTSAGRGRGDLKLC